LLKSGKPRLIIRKSNRHLLLQLAKYEPDGDRILTTMDSKTLQKHGWSKGTKSIPAAYFTGVLLARAAHDQKIREAIVDIGLQRHAPGGRICAAIKGAIDGGLAIPADASIFPSADRIAGKHNGLELAVSAFAQTLGVKLPQHETQKKETKKSKAAEAAPPKAAKAPKPDAKDDAQKKPKKRDEARS
jgi:ribosomal protein L18